MSIRAAAARVLRTVELRTLRLRRRPPHQPMNDPLKEAKALKELEELYRKATLIFWSAERPPQRFIRPDVPPADRTAVIDALRGGRKVAFWMGWAQCRICAKPLGSADMLVSDMVYPERADHYLSEHEVWTPGVMRCCDVCARDLAASSPLRRLRSSTQNR